MLLGIFFFSVNDAVGKWLLFSFSVWQVVLLRSVAAMIVLAPLIRREGWRRVLRPPRLGLQALRAACGTLDVVCFYTAVAHLPLADVMTIYMAAPIIVTGASILFLGERISWRAATAVGIAFAGVLLALRPSSSVFGAPSLVALVGCAGYAGLLVCTRGLRDSSDTVLVTWQMASALVVGVVGAPFAWVTPSAVETLLLFGLGVVALLAHMFVNRSLKLAPASVVVPYQYTLIVWAVLFGFLAFGDVPTPAVVAGAGVIVASGLWLFLAEQRAR